MTKAIKFGDQGLFHPLEYLKALFNEYIKIGGVIQEWATVKEINKEDSRQTITVGNCQDYVADAVVYAPILLQEHIS